MLSLENTPNRDGTPPHLLLVAAPPDPALDALLKGRRLRVSRAEGVEAALALMRETSFDLALVAVEGPSIETVCQRILAAAEPALPILAATPAAHHAAALRAGAHDAVAPPLDTEVFAHRVRNLLRARHALQLRNLERRAAEAEMARLRAQLVELDRLASLGRLARGVAHEMCNLSTLLDFARLEVDEAVALGRPPAPETSEELRLLNRHIKAHALSLSRLGRPDADRRPDSLLQVPDVVRSVSRALTNSGMLRRIDLQLELQDGCPAIRCAPIELEQVVLNLAWNATHAVGGRPSAAIRMTVARTEDGLELAVEDNGPGFPDHVADRAFEPYVTSRAEQGGTGLGLAIVKQLVEGWGGRVSVASRVEGGARVSVRLPRGVAEPSL